MSATTVISKNRNTIYERILKAFLEGGNSDLLNRYFALGKGWSKAQKHFQYLYLELLCNFSCDIEWYFNEKLKSALDVGEGVRLTRTQQVSMFNEEYNTWIEEGNSGDFVTFLLEQINVGNVVNWQESNW